MGFKVGGNYALPDISQSSPALRTYAAVPSTNRVGVFADIVTGVANVGVRAAVKATKSVLTGGAGGDGFGSAGDAVDSLKGLLEQQIAIQAEMQEFTMATNIEHSKHETKMAAIRNMRVG